MTMEQWTHVLSALGPAGIACALFVLGRLSARMHETTRGAPVYRAFYAGALLLAISAAARLIGVGQGEALEQTWLWVILYDGLPIIGIVISLVAAWHVWAWLLAERD
jgi:hypothetical protein